MAVGLWMNSIICKQPTTSSFRVYSVVNLLLPTFQSGCFSLNVWHEAACMVLLRVGFYINTPCRNKLELSWTIFIWCDRSQCLKCAYSF